MCGPGDTAMCLSREIHCGQVGGGSTCPRETHCGQVGGGSTCHFILLVDLEYGID